MKLGAWVKAHKKEAVIIGAAGVAVVYFLIKKAHGGSTAGNPGVPGVGTLTYNTIENPFRTVTKNHYEKVPVHVNGWAHYNFLEGERKRLKTAMGYERGWLAAARRAGNGLRVEQLTRRLKFQQGTLNSINAQARAAWLKAKGKK